jgi:hypothetical protein
VAPRTGEGAFNDQERKAWQGLAADPPTAEPEPRASPPCLERNVMTAPRRPSAGLRRAAPLATLPLALSLMLALASPLAQSRERHTTVTGAGGQSASRHVSRAQGDVQSSTSGPRGHTTSRSVDRRATGADAAFTGPHGGTTTRSTTRSETGSTTTVTGPQGQSGTVTVEHP